MAMVKGLMGLVAAVGVVLGAGAAPASLASRGAAASTLDPVYFVVLEKGSPYHGDSYVVPITDGAALREARDVINGRNGVETIVVCRITVGSDGINRDVLAPGEPLWSWHVVEFLGFAELTAEVMDGWPGLVESNPYAYVQAPPEGDNTGLIGFWGYTVSEELGAGPGISPPSSPTGPTLSALGGGQARVTWTDRSNNEEGFEIQRQKKVGNFWSDTTVIALGPNATTYTDVPGVGTFQYRVRSYNIGGSSAWTAFKTIKVK